MVYDLLFGNTKTVAKALASGKREHGIEIDCVRANAVDAGALEAYDMIVISRPTHGFGLLETLKTLTKRLNKVDVKIKQAFAFDTICSQRWKGDHTTDEAELPENRYAVRFSDRAWQRRATEKRAQKNSSSRLGLSSLESCCVITTEA